MWQIENGKNRVTARGCLSPSKLKKMSHQMLRKLSLQVALFTKDVGGKLGFTRKYNILGDKALTGMENGYRRRNKSILLDYLKFSKSLKHRFVGKENCLDDISGCEVTPQNNDLVPVVYVKNVLTTQGRIKKDDFMNYFGLGNKATQCLQKEVPLSGLPAKFAHSYNIPISSDLGRMLRHREGHKMPEEAKAHRMERIERYLNGECSTKSEVEYPVSYNRKSCHMHEYNFPQSRNTLPYHDPSFLLQFCKPVTVNVERLDISQCLKKNNKTRKRLKLGVSKKWRCCLSRELNMLMNKKHRYYFPKPKILLNKTRSRRRSGRIYKTNKKQNKCLEC